MRNFTFLNHKLAFRLVSSGLIFIFLAIHGHVFGITKTAAISGNWNNAATWLEGAVPTAGDEVIIGDNIIVTVNENNATCSSLTLGDKSKKEGGLIFNAGSILTVHGLIAILSTNGTNTINMSSGGVLNCTGISGTKLTFTPGAGTVEFNGAGALIIPALSYNNLTISGNRGSNSVTLASGTINVSGNYSATATFTTGVYNVSGNTFVLNGSGIDQTISGTPIFNNLNLSSTGTKNFGTSIVTIAGTFTKSAGTMDPGTGTIIFTGSAGAISGTGAKTFYDLQINSGAIITHDVGMKNITINNNFTNNGTFSQHSSLTTYFAGNGVTHSLTGNGTTTFGVVDINRSNTVNTGASDFTLSGSKFDVNGTFNGGTGTVTINGTTTITGTGSINFNHLTLTSGSGVKTIDAQTAVAVNGTLTTNNLLAINSDATKSGSLILGASGNCSGTVTYNRYFAPTRWYIAASPVNVSTGGFNIPANSAKINKVGGEYDLAWYKESSNDGWQYYTSFPEALAKGAGYLISLNKTENNGDGLIQFTGTLNNSDVTPSVTGTATDNGWNAVGNPYTSAIKIVGGSGTGSFLNINSSKLSSSYAAIYVWNETGTYNESQQYYRVIGNSGYTSPVDGATLLSGVSNIQAGQGFLINVNANTTVTFNKAMQVSVPDLSLKSAETSWPGITLLAQSKGQTRSTAVAFNEQMTNDLDVTYDAGLLATDDFQVYTHLVDGGNTIDFAIQCLPDHQYSQLSVPVGVDLPEGGEVVFKATGIILPDGMYPILEDKILNIKTPLTNESDSYTVKLAKSTSGTGRFYLSVGGDMALPIARIPVAPSFTASLVNSRITINGAVESGTKAFLFDIRGRKVGEYRLEKSNRNEISVSGLNQQVYFLKIEGKKMNQVIKLLATIN